MNIDDLANQLRKRDRHRFDVKYDSVVAIFGGELDQLLEAIENRPDQAKLEAVYRSIPPPEKVFKEHLHKHADECELAKLRAERDEAVKNSKMFYNMFNTAISERDQAWDRLAGRPTTTPQEGKVVDGLCKEISLLKDQLVARAIDVRAAQSERDALKARLDVLLSHYHLIAKADASLTKLQACLLGVF